MSRDKLDNILRARLADYREEPPVDLWSAIEADLNPKPKIVLPSRRRLGGTMLRYAAVAAVLFGVMFTVGHLYRMQETIVAKVDIPARENEFMPEVPINKPNVMIAEGVVGETSAQVGARRQLVAMQVSSVDVAVQETTLEQSIDTSEKKQIVVQSIAIDENRSGDNSAIKSGSAQEQMPTRSSVPEWYRELENEDQMKRAKQSRAANKGFSASVYAANVAVNSSTQTHTGSSMAASMSLFPLTEVVNITGGLGVLRSPKISTMKHKFPISVGVDFSYWFNKRLALQSGLTYSYMNSESDSNGEFNYGAKQQLHYLGVPIALTYSVLANNMFELYARGGGMIERGISGKKTLEISGPDSQVGSVQQETIRFKGVQPSLSASIGGQINLSPRFGIYAEPGLSYYFENCNQPTNYRSENPLNFSLRAGIRINFR